MVAGGEIGDLTAGEQERAEIAQVLHARCAPAAQPAAGEEGQHHVVADLPAGGVRPDLPHDAGAFVDTPPAYSAQTNIVVAASRDLQVHAIDAATGARRWRVKPTGRTQAATSAIQKNAAEVRRGWPVIAEGHGVVFIRYRLDWSTLWTWTPWPDANAQMRANLTQRPDQQALYALRLDTGAVSFIPNVGNGGFGDGDYMPMGPLPTVKRFDDGSEVAYVAFRGACLSTAQQCDGRGDARLGEMVMDSSSVAMGESSPVKVRFSLTNSTWTPARTPLTASATSAPVTPGRGSSRAAYTSVTTTTSAGASAAPNSAAKSRVRE